MIKRDKQIKLVSRYLSRQQLLGTTGSQHPPVNLQACIVIPSFNEPDLFSTLASLSDCDSISKCTEVIIVLNSGEESESSIIEFHRAQQQQISASSYPFSISTLLLENIPSKKAGVGFARKAGMDAALSRLRQVNNENGIIICLDGDCTVASNYLVEIINYFSSIDAKQAVHLHFEHPFPEVDMLKKSIIEYELHLRLMKLFLQEAGHPQAYYAVGSCLAVRAWAYAAQGGMNSRQAGEDFYFIHKFSNIGQLHELRSTTVYPASRVSDRVPFGTGAAITKASAGEPQLTYDPQSYQDIKDIIKAIPLFYKNEQDPIALFKGFQSKKIQNKLAEIRSNTASEKMFKNRFFQWFDAFQVIKFLHHVRDAGNHDVSIREASALFFNIHNLELPDSLQERLSMLRQLEKRF